MIPVIAVLVLGGAAQLADSAPVSQAEAYQVLSTVQNAMSKALHVQRLKAPKLNSKSNEPLAREALLDEFQRIANGFKNSYKLTPRRQYLDAKVIKVSSQRKPEAIGLIRLGYIDTMSPVVVGPKSTLTVEEFGQAVAYFAERWADRTHLPSAQYSPALMADPTANNSGPKGGSPSGPRAPAPAKPVLRPTSG